VLGVTTWYRRESPDLVDSTEIFNAIQAVTAPPVEKWGDARWATWGLLDLTNPHEFSAMRRIMPDHGLLFSSWPSAMSSKARAQRRKVVDAAIPAPMRRGNGFVVW